MKTLPLFVRIHFILLFTTLFTLLGLLALPQEAIAGPLVGVFQGEEIVVSLNPGAPLPGAMQRSQLAALTRPTGLSMKPLVGTRRVGVLSYSTTTTTRSRKIVQADSALIAQHCQRIIASNPGTSMSCEPNTVVKAVRYPNDPGYSELWGMRIMGAPVAWEMSTGNKSVTVAVVDTGIERTHPDLAANMLTNTREINGNGIDDDDNGYVDDFYGYDFYSQDGDPNDEFFHGTHCAGTIGGVGNNGRGVTGVAWNVSLLGVRIMGPNGTGSVADLALGIQYAVSRGASVINLSLGAGQSSAVENAITEARLKDVVIVAAAGNSGSDNDLFPFYPASSPSDNVIAVAASDSTDTLTTWSNYGAASVDVAAPGDSIYSTMLNGQYGIVSGTSMATPHVAGIVAVMRSVNPSLTYTQIKNILINSAQRQASMQGKIVASGRANFFRAVLAAGGTIPTPTPEPTLTATPTPLPTATPTPIPYTVSLSAEKLGTFTRFFGSAINLGGVPLTPLFVDLICGGQYRASGRTNANGSYEIFLNSLSAGLSCYVQDEFGKRTGTVTSP